MRFFLTTLHSFYNGAKDQIDVLVEMHKNMTTMYVELVEYFCLDVKKTSMEEFFGDIKAFLDEYEVMIMKFYLSRSRLSIDGGDSLGAVFVGAFPLTAFLSFEWVLFYFLCFQCLVNFNFRDHLSTENKFVLIKTKIHGLI